MNISLIIPCFNEETNIQKGVLDKIGNFTQEDNRFSEVLIVDDGSSDKTKEIVKERYLPHFPKFKLITNPHQGKAFTVITGIQKAKGDFILFSDVDLATPLEESAKLIDAAENGYDVAIGSRSSTREGAPLTRKIMALGMIFIRSYVIGVKGIKDTQCGFKLFNRKVALELINGLQVFKKKKETKDPSVSAGFDLELLFLATKKNYKIKEIPVEWRHVETKRVNFIKDSIETLKDIFMIKIYDITKKYNLTSKI